MIPVSNTYRRQLIAGNRNWKIKVNMTLKDNTALILTNEHIWDNGITLDNAISSDSSFDIGSAIVGSLKVIIDNITGNFSQYDFYDARLTLWLGVEGDVDGSDNQIYYRIGFYVVDVPTYNGSLITLECLDNMIWFDTPFSEVTGITYPATAGTVVQAICSHVGVTLGTPSFPNYQASATEVPAQPDSNLSCREVIERIAQMCCCYCKINTAGQLALTWYNKNEIIQISGYDGGTFNTTTTPYSDGDDVDGGHFNPWDGDNADGGTFEELRDSAYLSQNFEIEVSTDDIVVTGCRVRNNASNESGYDVAWVDSSLEADHDRYLLVIDDNPFIDSETNASEIANIVGQTLAGLPIRGFSATSLADFSYETGDVVTIVDFRGNVYHTWITHTTFTTNNSEQFSCGVESVKKRGEQRFSTLAETIEKARAVVTAYDNAVQAMNELAKDAIGYNEYFYPDEKAANRVTYRFDAIADMPTAGTAEPKFPNSNVVFKISGDGVFIARRANGDIDLDGTCHYSNGYDANSGTAILDLLYAHGIQCDWIQSGTLTLGGNGNVNGWLKILNASGQQIGKWDANGISASAGTFSGTLSAASGTFAGNLSAAGGTFAGTLSAARGTMSDGTGTLSLDGGNLYMVSATSGGSGVFAEKSGTSYYACWGAVNSAARNSESYLETSTYNIIRAGVNASDRRLKKKIKDIDADFAKDLILNIEPKSFYYKKNKGLPSELQFGVIAQDVQKIEEEHGITEANTLCYEEEDGMLAVQYKQLIAPMIKVIQEQQKQIDELKQKVGE